MRIPAPETYGDFSAFELLEALRRGWIPADHRLLHALVDDPAASLDDIVAFALGHPEDSEDGPPGIQAELVKLFNYLPAKGAIPFLIGEVRRAEGDIDDELTEALVRLGADAIGPLLTLYEEADTAELRAEVAFLLAACGVRDGRIEALMARIAESDPEEAQFLETVLAGERGAMEPYDIWKEFPEVEEPFLGMLSPGELRDWLDSGSPSHRLWALHSLQGEELPKATWKRIDRMFRDPEEALEVRCAAAALLAGEPDGRDVFHEVVSAGYERDDTRADALEAMSLSGDQQYAPLMVRHAEDANPRVRYQALMGVGLLEVRSETARIVGMLKDPEWRADALAAYAWLAPGENSPSGVRRIFDHIRDLADGLDEDEEEAVQISLDNRLVRYGQSPVFYTEAPSADFDDEEFDGADDAREFESMPPPEPITPVRSEKIGRNAPCPCGSGKKYKKCCGK